MYKNMLKTSSLISLFILTLLSHSLVAKELLMLTDDGPPHMIAASNSGIDVDITREVLQLMGHTVTLGFAPLKRTMRQVENKQADLFLPTFFQSDTDKLFFSKPIISYRPIALSLKKKKFKFNNISDLIGLKIVTFQGAAGYFGPEFVKASKFDSYFELHNMSKFPEMLIKERCDVVVLDYYIFYYYLQKYLKQKTTVEFSVKEIDEFHLFPEVKAHVGFHDKALRNNFDTQFELYKSQGKDKIVITKYLGEVNPK
ncbi:substrate-binding periplasmic protein [Colwellia piezophila]|uniref:substrate-binding periplasmic protein n=1 Tax=Colwellia piezophila TaxID=211668 RepID=UPI0003789D44|nr:transporter substrate-binding domain-containing protein [Colwellia piezophila]